MSSSYELMYILRPDLSEDQVGESVNKYKDYLNDNGAENLEIQVKGKRRLAYPVGKYLDAIRYLTIKLKKRAIIAAQNATAEPVSSPDDN